MPLYKRRFTYHSLTFKNIVSQARMATFARKLACARKKGINEAPLIEDLNNFLKSPLSSAEKKEIIQRYNLWALLLLHQNKKEDAFLLMSKGVKHNSSTPHKIIFKIANVLQSVFLLKILIKKSILFDSLKKKRYTKIF